jgi:hypothetical protein
MINLAETYLQQRTVLQSETEPKKILEKQTIQTKFDALIESINRNIIQLQNVYDSQKKNKKKVEKRN